MSLFEHIPNLNTQLWMVGTLSS